MNNVAHCELEPINQYFNNKPIYKCKYCNLTVALDNADTKILCFKKMEDLSNMIYNAQVDDASKQSATHLDGSTSLSDGLLKKIEEDAIEKAKKDMNHDNKENLCTNEQIESRLSICKTCEYFKNNSCLLCGCVVVREANHQNKLAHKNQKCPADKWGVIVD